MPYDEQLADRVRSALEGESSVEERRMMGGLVFLKDGAMVGGVDGERLFVRVAADRRDELLSEADVGPMTVGGKALKSFVALSPGAVETDADLQRWLRLGLQSVP